MAVVFAGLRAGVSPPVTLTGSDGGAAAALRSFSFEAASANLLPRWSPTRAEAFAATAADVFWEVEFESAFEGSRTNELCHAGVNGVSVPSLRRPDAFGTLTPCGSPKLCRIRSDVNFTYRRVGVGFRHRAPLVSIGPEQREMRWATRE